MNTTPDDIELQRRVLEARAWLRDGYTTMAKVDELVLRIARIRGQAAADLLREDMREQWRQRREWQSLASVDAVGAQTDGLTSR